jgi:uncharacterized membrane protein (UPF0127 family)
MSEAGDKEMTGLKFIAGAITIAVLAGVVYFTHNLWGAEDPYKSTLPVEKISIHTAGGDVSFDMEIAAHPVDLDVGLMFRKEMPKHHGMLFEMPGPAQVRTFWMKNTLIPLDMIFVAPDGHIVNIHHNAHPQDTTPISSREPASAVIEINGGLADEFGIHIGDKVAHPFFKG